MKKFFRIQEDFDIFILITFRIVEFFYNSCCVFDKEVFVERVRVKVLPFVARLEHIHQVLVFVSDCDMREGLRVVQKRERVDCDSMSLGSCHVVMYMFG